MQIITKLIYSTLVIIFIVSLYACNMQNADLQSAVGPSGQGGSMARFALHGQYLYVATSDSLITFKTSVSEPMEKVHSTYVRNDVETIFPYQNHLFLGTQSGMFIYDLGVDGIPEYRSRYDHIVSCDPVVVQGQTAYVTLRTDNACFRGSNQLDIIDVSDLDNPNLLTTHEMTNPHGLGISGDQLFICEGSAGLKVFNTLDNHQIELKEEIKGIHAYDVIPVYPNLIVTGNDGIYQYDFVSADTLTLLSKINSTQ